MAYRKNPVDENGVPLEQPFERYLIHTRLADGMHGALFVARDTLLDEDVVLRDMRLPLPEDAEETVATFFGEARAVARLRHPNVVRALDCGRIDDRFYISHEYVRGLSLREEIEKRGRPSEADVLACMIGALRGLEYLHDLGMTHGSIAPSNIILAEDGPARLCDLGVAKELFHPSPAARYRLSPWYAAPEQLEDGTDPDIRADLYGIGAVLYEYLVGAPPTTGETADAVADAILAGVEIDSPRTRAPTLSAFLSGVVMDLLAHEPDARPRRPSDVLDRLSEHPDAPPSLRDGLAAEEDESEDVEDDDENEPDDDLDDEEDAEDETDEADELGNG